MKPKYLKFCAAALLVILTGAVLWTGTSSEMVVHEDVATFAEMARRMNIRNMVAAIYLGPRILDTFLEVMVVVLAVFGIKYVREVS